VRGADVVHVLGFRDPVGTIAALHAQREGVPYVLEPTGMVHPRLRSFALKRAFDSTLGRVVLRHAAAVIATSELEAKELRAHHVPGERIHVRPNGVRFDELLPLPERGAFRGRYGIPPEASLVLTIARIGAVKGLPTLMRAMARVPEAHLAIAGPDERDGTLRALDELRRAPELRERVLVLQRGIWGETKREALADADVFCLPSDFESFGTAAAEAVGCGLPLVTTSGCGIADLLDPSGSRVVPPGETSALASALRETLASSVREAAERSAAALRQRLDWGAIAQRQLQIYRTVASN
jgi:glycosyltransferase involved in cell wall biosynthesis